ncbi:MAG: exodeoxyribonuclease III [Gammaproteobacteria bacterium]|nr:exodeoxyribonuclease III [Gammaproteobacteria bacterium]MDE2349686.1 exodeoxyribonuclease III [Gammaproteobacteria bacterium]
MKCATWNVNSLRVRLPQLRDWLGANDLDVVALQETKLQDSEFPRAEIEALGYHAVFSGQKTYNGVAILSRLPVAEVSIGLPDSEDTQRRLIAATVGPIRLINVYVPNGQAVGSEKYAYKLDWMQRLDRFLADELAAHERLLLAGDFNVAPDDRDVHDPQSWEGSVLVSAPEREALSRLAAHGMSDLFRRFEQPPQSFSWWDYRQGAYRRNHGLRIDLMLASARLAAVCAFCRIDREPRAWERPSDHAPCTAGFDLSPAGG